MTCTCRVCDMPTRLHINGIPACINHAEDVLRLAINIEALEVGADPEQAERVITEMLNDMRQRFGYE